MSKEQIKTLRIRSQHGCKQKKFLTGVIGRYILGLKCHHIKALFGCKVKVGPRVGHNTSNLP